MEDLKFRILEIKKNTDVTTITAECVENGVGITASIPSIFAYDKYFVKSSLEQVYIQATQESCVKVGEII